MSDILKWFDYIFRVGKKVNEKDILDHIQKHCNEYHKKRKDPKNWMDSMINLIAIYRSYKDIDILDYSNMIERMEKYRKKKELKK